MSKVKMEVPVAVNFDVVCSWCGRDLCHDSKVAYGRWGPELLVDPCSDCVGKGSRSIEVWCDNCGSEIRVSRVSSSAEKLVVRIEACRWCQGKE